MLADRGLIKDVEKQMGHKPFRIEVNLNHSSGFFSNLLTCIPVCYKIAVNFYDIFISTQFHFSIFDLVFLSNPIYNSS